MAAGWTTDQRALIAATRAKPDHRTRADTEVEQGELPIRGVAWSGAAPIARVEVSIGCGPWQCARLMGEPRRHSWHGWEFIARLEQPGSTVIAARATDMAGRTQPDSPEWNRLGYGNNAIQKVRVDVR